MNDKWMNEWMNVKFLFLNILNIWNSVLFKDIGKFNYGYVYSKI